MKILLKLFGIFCLVAGTLSTAFADAKPTSGWRGDGSGRFPLARPPVEWSKDSDNIVWKVEIGSGYSSPVLCPGGDDEPGRIFLTVEPTDVVCIDATDGKMIWRQSAGYEEALGTDESRRITETHAALDAERRRIGKEYNELRKSDPDSPRLETLKEHRASVEQKRREFQRQYPSEKRGGARNAAATVVCDGRHVFAVFGTGIVAAFTVDGDPVWIKHLEAPLQGFGHSASPVIAGGRLIVHIQQLTALETTTGKELWQAEVPAKFGTPLVTTISGEDVIVTPSGAFVAAQNGRLLAEKQFQLSENSPIVHDGVLYAHGNGRIKAFRLPDTLNTPFELKLLWEASGSRDQRMASAVYHNGLLYAGGRRGIMDVTDATTGELVYRERLEIGDLFSSPTIAGEFLYFGGKNGTMLVLRPGRTYDEVAINQCERFSTTPLFAGHRMYLRGDKFLYCISGRSE